MDRLTSRERFSRMYEHREADRRIVELAKELGSY